jgi:excisionase family DNA binding protein
MARVIAMLREARAAGLVVRREGDALIVRGPEDLGSVARNLLAQKPLALAALPREDELRGHELSTHGGEYADWRSGGGGRVICATRQPSIPGIDDELSGVVGTVMATADQAAAGQPPAPRACPTCGSSGRCEGRLPTAAGSAVPPRPWGCSRATGGTCGCGCGRGRRAAGEAVTLAEAPDVLTVDECAQLARIGPKPIYRAIRKGELYGRRIGKSIRVPKRAFGAWLDGVDSAEPPDLRIVQLQSEDRRRNGE